MLTRHRRPARRLLFEHRERHVRSNNSRTRPVTLRTRRSAHPVARVGFLMCFFMCLGAVWGHPMTNWSVRLTAVELAYAEEAGLGAASARAVGMPITVIADRSGEPTRRATFVLLSGTTLLAPVDDISAAIGAESARSGQVVTVRLAERRIQLQAAERRAVVNGSESILPAAPVEMNGILYVPLSAVAEALGWSLRWDARKSELFLNRAVESPQNTLPSAPGAQGRPTVPAKDATANALAEKQSAQPPPSVPPVTKPVDQSAAKPAGKSADTTANTPSAAEKPAAEKPTDSKPLTADKPGSKAAEKLQITALRLSGQDGRVVVEIQGTGPLTWKTTVLRTPDRLVIDFPGATVAKTAASLPGDGMGLRGVRIAQYTPQIARVVVDLAQPTTYEVKGAKDGTALSVILHVAGIAPIIPNPQLPSTTMTGQSAGAATTTGESVEATQAAQPSSLPSQLLQPLGMDGVAEAAGRPAPPPTSPPSTGPSPIPPAGDGNARSSRPAGQVAGAVVVIDPGHGGTDPGASSARGTMEKTIALAISLKVAQLLAEQGVQVLLTRDTDMSVDKPTRVRLANSAMADALVSIHLNSTGSTGVPEGTETLYLGHRPENLILAKFIQDAVVGSLTLRNRGVKQRTDLYLLKYSEVPTALVEVAFLNGAEEEDRLLDEAFLTTAAMAIRDGIVGFLQSQPTVR